MPVVITLDVVELGLWVVMQPICNDLICLDHLSRVHVESVKKIAVTDNFTLPKAQQELVEAGRQSSAQTRAKDLKGYGREAQTLVSAQRLVARTQGFQATARELTTRMQIQDVTIGRAAEAVGDGVDDRRDDVTTFTAGQQKTLPIWMLDELVRPRQRPVTNVVAIVVFAATFLPILFAYTLTRGAEETAGGGK